MLRRGGIRARLALTLVAMVALTAILLGAGAYVFVETSLHDQVLRDAAAQARFDLSVTVPNRGLPADPTPEDIVDSGLRETFLQRGVDTITDVGSGEPVVSRPDLVGELANLPDDFTKRVARRRARLHLDDASPATRAWSSAAGSAVPDRPSTSSTTSPRSTRRSASSGWR